MRRTGRTAPARKLPCEMRVQKGFRNPNPDPNHRLPLPFLRFHTVSRIFAE